MKKIAARRQKMLVRANALYEAREYARAAELTGEMLAALPEDVEMRYIRAAALTGLGTYEEARAEIARIRALRPDHVGAARQEIYIDRAEGKFCTAITHLRSLIAALEQRIAAGDNPAYHTVFLASAYSLLGEALTVTGASAAAVDAFRASSRLETTREKKAIEYSNALFAANYLPAAQRSSYANLARGYAALYADVTPLASRADAMRGHDRIRIGYISPDLRAHPVGTLVRPLLHRSDRSRFAVYCYMNGAEDRVSEEFRAQADAWRNIQGMAAEEIAARVRADEIDILVDLAGHTQNNCLPVLAHKPAPVQVTGIGYFNTTGLPAVSYMLSDVYVDPVGTADDAFTEEMIRLPRSHFCYTLPADLPAITPPPMERSGSVTFGSFNNFNKVTDEVLLLWREVLAAVPGARLLLKSKLFGSAEGRAHAAERFARCGIPAECVEMRGFTRDHLAEYGDMDIALDTFPYTGGITTCEALAMGVPVVTLRGESHGARFGESLLINANLPELIAKDPADYVQIARTLASSPETLCALRMNLRAILGRAPLTDAPLYVRAVEDAYAEIWEKFVHKV
jgi:TPR domain/SEC-C domain protein domain-containing protein